MRLPRTTRGAAARLARAVVPAAALADNMSVSQAGYLGDGSGGVATTDRRSP